MRFAQKQIVTNGDMSVDINSLSEDLNQYALSSIQAVWTGAGAAGTLKLQVSNDITPVTPATADPGANVVNWSDYTGSSVTVAGPGNFEWNIVYVGFRWLRLVFTHTGGSTGTLQATFNGKG